LPLLEWQPDGAALAAADPEVYLRGLDHGPRQFLVPGHAHLERDLLVEGAIVLLFEPCAHCC
jgi:hypothetical protein